MVIISEMRLMCKDKSVENCIINKSIEFEPNLRQLETANKYSKEKIKFIQNEVQTLISNLNNKLEAKNKRKK